MCALWARSNISIFLYYLPHERFCNLYYLRVNGCSSSDNQTMLTRCPNGLIFAGTGQQGLTGLCDYPHRTECNSGLEPHNDCKCNYLQLRAFYGRSAGALRALCGRSAGALRALCGRSAGALRALCGRSAGALRALLGRSAADLQALCGRSAADLRALSVPTAWSGSVKQGHRRQM
jgi:hypothetical protein